MHREQAAKIVAKHPWVTDVVVTEEGLGVRLAQTAVAVDPVPGPLLQEYLNKWRLMYDYVYVGGKQRVADDLDLSGWTTSDSGLPLPVDHMTEWVDRTVELVLRQRPRHVLELGCGSGLLLYRLYREVDSYVGTDISPVTVNKLTAVGLPGVAVVKAAAHEARSAVVSQAWTSVAGLSTPPDCVVLNSVSMHFPNAEYFSRVLHDALELVTGGGTVVVGDVRHFGLLPAYCQWLEQTADPNEDVTALQDRARARAEQEEQLLAAPEFIIGIAAESGRDVQVSVHPKTMQGDTELTRYRYDIVLYVDPREPVPTARPLKWSKIADGDPLPTLRMLVEGAEPVEIRDIPNRLLLPDTSDAVSAAELYLAVGGTDATVHLDIADPTQLAVATPGEAGRRPATAATQPRSAIVHEPFQRYLRQRVPEVLRSHLRRNDSALGQVRITLSDDDAA